eukprot:4125177-Alexandrium_andersonii.AAC.1
MGLWIRWSSNPTAASPSAASPGAAVNHAAAPALSSSQAPTSVPQPYPSGGASRASMDRPWSHSASGRHAA